MNFFSILILFTIFSAFVNSNLLEYSETQAGLEMFRAFTFKDEIVIQMTEGLNKSTNCIEPTIHLRYLRRDGTIEPSKVDFPISEINFCLGPTGFLPTEIYSF